jgi:hypothetical protein
MNPHVADGDADAGAKFEETNAEGFDLDGFEFGSLKDLLVEENHECVSGGGHGETEGIGQKPVAGETMSEETEFHILEVVLGVSPLFVLGEEFFGGSGKGGNEEADVGAVFGGLEFDAHLAGTVPFFGAVASDEKPPLGFAGLSVPCDEFPEGLFHLLPGR